MKKRKIFAPVLATIAILVASFVVPKSKSSFAKEQKNNPDCATLRESMPTIGDILRTEHNKNNSGETSYSTWGTVTAIYTQGNYYHAFIQNAVEGKESAALCMYNTAPTSSSCPLKVGDFVTVHGTLSYYRGMYEMMMDKNGNTFTVQNDIEAYPVISESLSVEQLTASPSDEYWTKNILKGNVRTQLNNVEIVTYTKTYSLVKTGSSSKSIKLYYGGIGTTSEIQNKMENAYTNRYNISVTGYLSAFDYSSRETQLLIRYASDIETIETYTPVTDLVFYNTYKELSVGDQYRISYDISPYNASNKTIIWSSSDTDVAIVDEDGVVTAISEGYVTIRGTSADNLSFYDTCDINVIGSNDDFVEVQSIEIDLPTPDGNINGTPYYNVNIGDTGTLSYTVYPTNATNKDVWFGCNNPDVVELDIFTGEWKVIGNGMAEIYVTSASNYSVEAIFSVICRGEDNSKLYRICFEQQDVTIGVGETVEIPFITVPENYDTSKLTYQCIYEHFEILGIEGHKIKIKGKSVYDGDFLNIYAPNNETDYAQISVYITKNTSTTDVLLEDVDVGSYNTNFGTKYLSNVDLKFAYYRAGRASDGIKLYPSVNLVRVDSVSLPGSFSNETAKNAFTSIDVTYSGAGTLRYGETKDCTNSYNLPSSSSDKTVTVNTNDAFFFYVEADKGETLDLIKLSFKFNANKTFNSTITTNSRVNTRIPATVYSGTLTPGVSYVDVPTDVSISGNSYTVKSTKRYTYYTFNYVKEHKDELNLEEIALTDPVDVANYFIAFHCAPVNYISYNKAQLDDSVGVKSLGSQTDVQQMFGNKARYVSKYSKTSGYAIGIPYYGSTPTYLEFDFDGNGKYSLNSRDVCRVVLWASGWEGTGYGANIPVATYTDDHYVTFREYNNYGGWNLPFDTKENGSYTQLRTNYYYGSTNTLSKR